ncbi:MULTISPECIES: peptidylprolyl isomerase [Streptomycetaceae]|uniref:Peptidyl-prolyl cis-trans isomerase n=1 Tax=Streptantibioticus cattleyicolor (strain ATCC 35852 / DSM 46488 / JCM 4925 / NBRC 14057 / NRRL 8057) TaxID=1003195 RepID=F8K4W2_STREN|nr:peptidylprolyl isomerase [Streptantibioticus cattleyicolor]AEW97681.1 peptidyl-prolyl cis-trans isomerase [Streptantibioticus cattleyicolor NRRL 8057 = DSM 46488]MYS62106.1 peptidylprolyl isomerase [Streptomyces sp. SID5468]CCB78001.1 putative peptidyl-prolyl cis-trans isomerase [Streptantibioticus cattleyicolor NRRL 8057 = DSM 46488]
MASKDQRRRQLAREKYQRQQERRAAQRAKARRRNTVIGVVVAVAVAAGAAAWASTGLGGDGHKTDAAAPSGSATTPGADHKGADPCGKPAPGSPGTKQWKSEPAMTIDKGASYTMDLRTTCGDIALKLDAAAAPHTVNSFNFLAAQGFFDHTRCHRLTTSAPLYVLQCGDPKGTGQGGPGYTIPDENLKAPAISKGTYPAGTVAMANTGQPHSGGSQFFLVYKDSRLPASYTPFGTVSPEGMKVLQKIAAAGESTGSGDGAPNATVVVDKATVTRS